MIAGEARSGLGVPRFLAYGVEGGTERFPSISAHQWGAQVLILGKYYTRQMNVASLGGDRNEVKFPRGTARLGGRVLHRTRNLMTGVVPLLIAGGSARRVGIRGTLREWRS